LSRSEALPENSGAILLPKDGPSMASARGQQLLSVRLEGVMDKSGLSGPSNVVKMAEPSSIVPDYAGKVSETCLDEISRKHRQRKAVKSDKAQVPEYLWKAHLLEGCEGINQDGDIILKVCTVINWLRKQMLNWWKRKVTSSYVAWVKSK
jgi:hypothetical protein